MKTHVPPALYSVDLGGCTDLVDRSPDEIAGTFCAALRRAGATVVSEHSHSFPGAGLTCVLILSESHAVLHTWPETGTVNLDIFSCSTRLKSLEAIDELRRSSGAQHVTVQEILRRTRPAVARAQLGSRCGQWHGASSSSVCSV
jgi:S-adenosylmethionine decarboxylase proenzyme